MTIEPSKNLIVIIDITAKSGSKPYPLNCVHGDLKRFSSVDEIEELKDRHILGEFPWWSLDYATGKTHFFPGR